LSARFDILILLQGRDPFAAKGFQFSSLVGDLRNAEKNEQILCCMDPASQVLLLQSAVVEVHL
jgi:hypothetical protein